MNLTRRQRFHAGAAACAAAGTVAIGPAPSASALERASKLMVLDDPAPIEVGVYGSLLTTMAVLSDTHVDGDEPMYDNNLSNALNDISQNWENLDTILLNGDITNNGYDFQYDIFSEIAKTAGYSFSESFTCVMGNHDKMGDASHTPESYKAMTSMFFERTGNTSFYFDTYIGGTHVVVLGPDQYISLADISSSDVFELSETQLAWLSSLLDADEAEGMTSFVFIHEPLKNTVTDSYPGGWGYDNSLADDDALHSVIYSHNHTILFSGHTHSFPDVVHQGGGNLYVGTGSVAYAYAKDETYLTDDENYDSYGWLVRHHEKAVEFCMRDFLNHEWVSGSHYICALEKA